MAVQLKMLNFKIQWFGSFLQVGAKVPEFIGFRCNPAFKGRVIQNPTNKGL